MKAITHIEQSLAAALSLAESTGGPPKLAAAVRHAVFPGGARVRPRLCLAVAAACGNSDPLLADGAAVAVELLHCASLVHDDLPCFDDAATRRGRASVQWAFGVPLAVLAGDALIVLAFETIARAGERSPARIAGVLRAVAAGAGTPFGIVAGQAWESESRVCLRDYQQAKTGALFEAAVRAGAISAGSDPDPWAGLGRWLGEAYQVADDIRDAAADPALVGKPVGQDLALGRPSAARELGLDGALNYFRSLITQAQGAIPECKGAPQLSELVAAEADRLLPATIAAAIEQTAHAVVAG